MKKFTVNCDFGGQIAPFAVYIGTPEGSHHPLHFQAEWLSKNRGGSIPPDIMEAVGRLKELADKNGVSLEELCVYALGAAQQEKDEGSSPNEQEMGTSSEADVIATETSSEDENFDFDFDDLVMTPSEDAEGEELEFTDEELNLEAAQESSSENQDLDPTELEQEDGNKHIDSTLEEETIIEDNIVLEELAKPKTKVKKAAKPTKAKSKSKVKAKKTKEEPK